jgi:hypothetical protein
LTAASHAPRSDLRAVLVDVGFGPASAHAGELPVALGAGDAGADGEALGVFVFAAVRLACFGMKEETSAPLLRLAYIHLLASLDQTSGRCSTA